MILLKKMDDVVEKILYVISAVCLVSLFALLVLNVFFRFFPIYTIGWFDEIVELLFAWMVFCQAAVLWKHNEHPYIDIIESKIKSKHIKLIHSLLINIVNVFFLILFTYYSYQLIIKSTAWSPIFQIPRSMYYLCMFVSGAYMSLHSVKNIVVNVRELLINNKLKAQGAI